MGLLTWEFDQDTFLVGQIGLVSELQVLQSP